MKKNHALLLAAATGIALFGCATDMVKSGPCNEQVCFVRVNIVACNKGGGGISAYPDPVHIGRGTHEIHFDLATTEYEFTDNGISFKKPHGGVFSDPRKLTPTKYKWHDDNRNSTGGPVSYEYNIELMARSGQICRYDPTIVND